MIREDIAFVTTISNITNRIVNDFTMLFYNKTLKFEFDITHDDDVSQIIHIHRYPDALDSVIKEYKIDAREVLGENPTHYNTMRTSACLEAHINKKLSDCDLKEKISLKVESDIKHPGIFTIVLERSIEK